MKTILLISPYWKEQHRWMVSTVKLAELWQRWGYRVVVLCMGKGGIERVSETLEIHRRPDIFLPDPWNYGIAFGFSGHAVRLAREIKPDIIVVNKILFWSSIALLRLRFAGFRVLLITDALVGITWWGRGALFRFCSAIYAWTLGWLIMRAATKIVFFHPQPQNVLRTLGVEKKSSVIPTGIDPKPFEVASDKWQVVSGKLVTITYIGRLESVKGVDDFVAAALKIKETHPEAAIKVVGWYKEGHPLVASHSGKIEFTGLRKDIPEILGQTDIFVMPSYSEGLSNAIMEAMASGCAVVATAVGGNAFLIENGVSGFLFEPGDRSALAAHIERLIADPHKRIALGKAARARIENVFSWEKVGEQYRQYFDTWVHSG